MSIGQAPQISRLFVTDKSSGRDFLIDTGADLSVIPSNCRERGNAPCVFKLHATNGTQIKTFGSKTITLNLGLRRPIKWVFIIADVQSPIIGADLLKKHDLLIDVKNNKLRDNVTNIAIQGKFKQTSAGIEIKSLSDSSAYYELLQEFPDIQDHSLIKKTAKNIMSSIGLSLIVSQFFQSHDVWILKNWR